MLARSINAMTHPRCLPALPCPAHDIARSTMPHPSQALELIPAKDTSPVGLGWWFMSKRAFRYKISCKSGSEIAQLEDGAFDGAATPVSVGFVRLLCC